MGLREVTEARNVLSSLLQLHPYDLELLSQMTNILGQQGKHKEVRER